MKYFRNVLIGLAVFGMITFISKVSFAQEGYSSVKGNHEVKVKLLKDSSAALQKSNPDLAQRLNDYADKEAKAMQERKTQRETKVKLLKDAAAALEQSNPDLAKGLEEMSEAKPHQAMQKMMQKNVEKEEAGEKVESNSEKVEAIK